MMIGINIQLSLDTWNCLRNFFVMAKAVLKNSKAIIFNIRFNRFAFLIFDSYYRSQVSHLQRSLVWIAEIYP